MMNLKKTTNRAQEIIIELIVFHLLKLNSGRSFKAAKMNFNWGIIWSCLNPLIIVLGWALLFSLGIRGSGFDLSYFIFLLLFVLGFSKLVSLIIRFQLDSILINKKEINILNSIFSLYMSEFYLLLARFLLLVMVLNLFNFNLVYFHLLCGFLIITFIGFFYGAVLNAIFKNNAFLSELHNYFLIVVFITSSVIIPVSILPEPIRDIFLYNPLAHVSEWIKSASTGITLDYINIFYPLIFLLFLVIISPIFLWFTNKNQG